MLLTRSLEDGPNRRLKPRVSLCRRLTGSNATDSTGQFSDRTARVRLAGRRVGDRSPDKTSETVNRTFTPPAPPIAPADTPTLLLAFSKSEHSPLDHLFQFWADKHWAKRNWSRSWKQNSVAGTKKRAAGKALCAPATPRMPSDSTNRPHYRRRSRYAHDANAVADVSAESAAARARFGRGWSGLLHGFVGMKV